MVFESPAAVRLVVSRKHSPWTMERDRKKTKAHLGSPEPLSEEVEEELEDEEPDDHDMTEQEEQVLACLGQLNVGSSVASQAGDTDGAALSRAGSVPDGQRRKVRGSRALSASYHNRLRSCMLNDKGSPLPHSSRSYTGVATGGQENAAPVMFAPIIFGEHSKCWLGRRHSPNPQDASSDHPAGTTGVTHPSGFGAHVSAQSTAADQSLLAAAAFVNSARAEKLAPSESPAPKGRSHRRSLSGASVAAACGLNDSAEALHGPSENCQALEGRSPKSVGAWPHSRSVSEGSAQRHVIGVAGALRPGIPAGGDQEPDASGCATLHDAQGSAGGDARDGNPSKLSNQSFRAHTAVPLPPSPSTVLTTSSACVAKYGIAAFGIPASVQCCFADSMASSAQHRRGGTAADCAVGATSGPLQELVRSAPACPGDVCLASTAAAVHGWHAAQPANLESSSGIAAVGLCSGPLLELGTEPLADASSEPLIGGGHARLGGQSFGASGTVKALADSAEELELRRLTHYAPEAWPTRNQERILARPDQLTESQSTQQLQSQTLGAGFSHPRSASTGSAAAVISTVAGAVSEPLPGGLANAHTAPFDLVSLARSAGAYLGNSSSFSCFSTSGHFSTDAAQCAVGGPSLPSSFSRWPSMQRGDTRSQAAKTLINLDDSINDRNNQDGVSCNNDTKIDNRTKAGVKDNATAPAGCFGKATPWTDPVQSSAPDAPAGDSAQQHIRGDPFQSPLELNLAAVGGGAGDVRTEDQDDRGLDGEDSSSWLRTSQQAPDPDDPSSAGKYSAVLLRRLQAAAEHEELFGVASSGCHSTGAYSFYHLQESCGSHGDYGHRSSSGRLHLGSHGSSSVEPSPLPRLSSRLRRLRASPCLGGSGGSLTSPAPSSHLLGTRSRSAGVTPGGATCRRLRRRSDLLMADQQGGVSARGRADVDELDDSDAGADEHMHEAGGHGMLGSMCDSDGQLLLLAGQRGDQASQRHRQHQQHRDAPPPLHHFLHDGTHNSADGGQLAASPQLSSTPVQHLFERAGGANAARCSDGPGLVARAQSAGAQLLLHQPRGQPRRCEDFLSGLMDYDDDGVDYMTPPHTPLRGIGAAHELDAVTAPRAGQANYTFGGSRMPHNQAAAEGNGDLVAIAPGRGRQCLGKAPLQQRVTFAAHRLAGTGGYIDTPPSSPPRIAGGGYGGDSTACAQLLLSQSLGTTQEFNRCLSMVANSNDRGSAERLWQEMCSRGVMPDINTLNSLLRCLSRSAADPDEAHLLMRDVCNRGGFSANGTSQRLLEEICFRFEQLHGGALPA